MALAMIFLRSSLEMVKMDLEDLDYVEMGAIGWILLVVATVVAKMETTNLLR